MHFRGPIVEKLDQKYAIGPLKCILVLSVLQYYASKIGFYKFWAELVNTRRDLIIYSYKVC